VQRKAAACQRGERCAVTPITRQKTAHLPDAAQAIPVRSTTVTPIPRRLKK
jgi:hypothetical protein